MDVTERQIEAAEAMVSLERDDAIARIRAELTADGTDECIACGEPIPAARRRAMPSAERCITCQSTFEKGHP